MKSDESEREIECSGDVFCDLGSEFLVLRAAFQSDSVDFIFFLFWLLLQFTDYKCRKAQK